MKTTGDSKGDEYEVAGVAEVVAATDVVVDVEDGLGVVAAVDVAEDAGVVVSARLLRFVHIYIRRGGRGGGGGKGVKFVVQNDGSCCVVPPCAREDLCVLFVPIVSRATQCRARWASWFMGPSVNMTSYHGGINFFGSKHRVLRVQKKEKKENHFSFRFCSSVHRALAL